MRRVIRATYLGKEPGDLSSLENPAAVKAVAAASRMLSDVPGSKSSIS